MRYHWKSVALALTVATIICGQVEQTKATEPTVKNSVLDCEEHQKYAADRYSWEKPQVKVYRTMDPKDYNDPTVGILRKEDIPAYQAGIQTMDLRNFESRDKSDNQKTIDNHMDETIVDSHTPMHYQTEEKPEEHGEKIVTIIKNVKVPYEVEKIQHVPIIRHVPYELKLQIPPIPQPYMIERKIPMAYKVSVKIPSYLLNPHASAMERTVPFGIQMPIERRVPYRVFIPSHQFDQKNYYPMESYLKPAPYRFYQPKPQTAPYFLHDQHLPSATSSEAQLPSGQEMPFLPGQGSIEKYQETQSTIQHHNDVSMRNDDNSNRDIVRVYFPNSKLDNEHVNNNSKKNRHVGKKEKGTNY